MNRRGIVHIAAAIAYLLVALVLLRPVLTAPAARLPYHRTLQERDAALLNVVQADAAMVAATVARNAHRLVTAPATLRGDGQCFPLPRSYTLGEHMFTTGLLASPAYALSRDPILSFNFAVLLAFWIPGLAMYALSFYLTKSPLAAFVGGLAFALVPGRIADPTHPFGHADLWAPLALLFLHRLILERRLRDMVGLAVFTMLAVGESLYVVIATGLYLATFGLSLSYRHPRETLRALPFLAVTAAILALAGWAVFGPYLENRAVWGILSGRGSVFTSPGQFLPGNRYFPGLAVTALAAVALLDRLRGARREDGRLPALAAGLLLAWCACRQVPVPFAGSLSLKSPLLMASGIVPGLDAVRSLYSLADRVGVATSLLAAYGVLVLTDRRSRRVAVAVASLAAGAILVTRTYEPLARASFGLSLSLAAWEARPPGEDIALVRRSGSGAILEMPLPFVEHGFAYDAPASLLLASYGPRDSAACYNSFPSPLQRQVWLLAGSLPSRTSAEALAALGFGTVILQTAWDGYESWRAEILEDDPPLVADGSSPAHVSYALAPRTDVAEDLELLTIEPPLEEPRTPLPLFFAHAPMASIPFPIRNRGAATFRHPKPWAPSDLLVRWRPRDGKGDELESRARALLPLALGSGDAMPVKVETALPGRSGRYVAALARAAAPDEVISRREIEVFAPAAEPTPHEATVDLAVLVPGKDTEPLRLSGRQGMLSFAVKNPGPKDYRVARARPTALLSLVWVGANGRQTAEEQVRTLLPRWISAGAAVSIEVPAAMPAPGEYRALLLWHGHLLASRVIEVVRGAETSSREVGG